MDSMSEENIMDRVSRLNGLRQQGEVAVNEKLNLSVESTKIDQHLQAIYRGQDEIISVSTSIGSLISLLKNDYENFKKEHNQQFIGIEQWLTEYQQKLQTMQDFQTSSDQHMSEKLEKEHAEVERIGIVSGDLSVQLDSLNRKVKEESEKTHRLRRYSETLTDNLHKLTNKQENYLNILTSQVSKINNLENAVELLHEKHTSVETNTIEQQRKQFEQINLLLADLEKKLVEKTNQNHNGAIKNEQLVAYALKLLAQTVSEGFSKKTKMSVLYSWNHLRFLAGRRRYGLKLFAIFILRRVLLPVFGRIKNNYELSKLSDKFKAITTEFEETFDQRITDANKNVVEFKERVEVLEKVQTVSFQETSSAIAELTTGFQNQCSHSLSEAQNLRAEVAGLKNTIEQEKKESENNGQRFTALEEAFNAHKQTTTEINNTKANLGDLEDLRHFVRLLTEQQRRNEGHPHTNSQFIDKFLQIKEARNSEIDLLRDKIEKLEGRLNTSNARTKTLNQMIESLLVFMEELLPNHKTKFDSGPSKVIARTGGGYVPCDLQAFQKTNPDKVPNQNQHSTNKRGDVKLTPTQGKIVTIPFAQEHQKMNESPSTSSLCKNGLSRGYPHMTALNEWIEQAHATLKEPAYQTANKLATEKTGNLASRH